MKRILILIIGLIGVAYGQSSPTSAKTRFVNGLYVGTKLDSYFNAADSNAIYWRADSVVMAKYKGTARALAFAVSGGYLPILDTAAMLAPYLRRTDSTGLLSQVVRTFGTQTVGGTKTFTSGQVIKGTVGSGNVRTDATLLLKDSTFPFLVGYVNGGVYHPNDEFGISAYWKNNYGDSIKMWSINAKPADTTYQNEVFQSRLNVNNRVAGVTNDHDIYRAFGNGIYGSIKFFSEQNYFDADGVAQFMGNQLISHGSGATLRTNRFNVADFGVDEYSSTPRMNVGFNDFYNSKGLLFGYDQWKKQGVIGTIGTQAGISFWTNNGTNSAERMSIDSITSNLQLRHDLQMPTAASIYAGTSRIATWNTSNSLSFGDINNEFPDSVLIYEKGVRALGFGGSQIPIFYGLSGTGNRIPSLSSTGVVSRSTIDPSLIALTTGASFSGDIIMANGAPIRGTNTSASNRRMISIESDDAIHIAQNDDPVIFGNGIVSINKIKGLSPTPSIAGGSATYIGTGASTSVSGNDMSGEITLVTGTGCGSTGASNRSALTVTFASAYSTAPIVQIQAIQQGGLSSTDGPSSNFFLRRDAVGTSSFTVYLPIGVTLTDSTTYLITYQVIGR